jgi:hypothetical protein
MDFPMKEPAGLAVNLRWYQIWWQVWRHPGTLTYQRILYQQKIYLHRPILWVYSSSLIAYMYQALFYPISWAIIFRLIWQPIVIILGLFLSIGFNHWIAKLFNGKGDLVSLYFCISTIYSPVVLFVFFTTGWLPMLVSQAGAQAPVSGFIIYSLLSSIVSLVLICFVSVLYVTAINAVEKIGIGRSILVYCSMYLVYFIAGLLILGLYLASSHNPLITFGSVKLKRE